MSEVTYSRRLKGGGFSLKTSTDISGDEINSRVEKALEELKAKIAEKEAVNKSNKK